MRFPSGTGPAPLLGLEGGASGEYGSVPTSMCSKHPLWVSGHHLRFWSFPPPGVICLLDEDSLIIPSKVQRGDCHVSNNGTPKIYCREPWGHQELALYRDLGDLSREVEEGGELTEKRRDSIIVATAGVSSSLSPQNLLESMSLLRTLRIAGVKTKDAWMLFKELPATVEMLCICPA